MNDLAKELSNLFTELNEHKFSTDDGCFMVQKSVWHSIMYRVQQLKNQIESEDVLNIIQKDKNLHNLNKQDNKQTRLININPIDFILKVFYIEKINLNEKNLTFSYIRKILDITLSILNKPIDICYIPWTRVYVIGDIQYFSDILRLEGEDEVRLLLNNNELLKYVDNPVDYDRDFNLKLINAIDTARLKLSINKAILEMEKLKC